MDVSTAADAGLLGVSDPDHLSFALQEGRGVVTHDDDYVRLDASGVSHAGIAYCHQDKYTLGRLLQMLLLLDACYAAAEMHGRLEFL